MELTIDQIEQGRIKVIENSWSLLHDAIILFENKKYARAYTLSHLCIEELAKLHMLVSVGTKLALEESIDWELFEKRFSDHKFKIHIHNYYDKVILNSMGDVEASNKEYENGIHSASKINITKNLSLYVTQVDGEFRSPDETINMEMADEKLTEATEKYEHFRFLEKIMQGKIQEAIDDPEYAEEFKKISMQFNENKA